MTTTPNCPRCGSSDTQVEIETCYKHENSEAGALHAEETAIVLELDIAIDLYCADCDARTAIGYSTPRTRLLHRDR